MIVAAASAVASAAKPVADALGGITEGVAGLFGDTTLDKQRKAHASALLSRALAGDDAAVVALCYEAFEPRRGLPGDPRSPVDGKHSPQDVRDLAVGKLKTYVRERDGLPAAAAQWATQLRTTVVEPRPSFVGDVLGAVERGAAQGTQSAAAEKITATAAQVRPYLIAGGVALALGVAVYFATRK